MLTPAWRLTVGVSSQSLMLPGSAPVVVKSDAQYDPFGPEGGGLNRVPPGPHAPAGLGESLLFTSTQPRAWSWARKPSQSDSGKSTIPTRAPAPTQTKLSYMAVMPTAVPCPKPPS